MKSDKMSMSEEGGQNLEVLIKERLNSRWDVLIKLGTCSK